MHSDSPLPSIGPVTPPATPCGGLWCRLISLWHCFSRQSAAVYQRLVRGCLYRRNFCALTHEICKINQTCSFKMAALWPRSVLSFFMERDEKQPKGNLANIQRSWQTYALKLTNSKFLALLTKQTQNCCLISSVCSVVNRSKPCSSNSRLNQRLNSSSGTSWYFVYFTTITEKCKVKTVK